MSIRTLLQKINDVAPWTAYAGTRQDSRRPS